MIWLKKSFLSHLIFGILEYYAQKFNKLLSDTLEKNIPMIMKNLKLLFLFLVILFIIPTEARRREGVLVGIFGGDGELSWWKIIMINPPNHLLVERRYYHGDGSKIRLLPWLW